MRSKERTQDRYFFIFLGFFSNLWAISIGVKDHELFIIINFLLALRFQHFYRLDCLLVFRLIEAISLQRFLVFTHFLCFAQRLSASLFIHQPIKTIEQTWLTNIVYALLMWQLVAHLTNSHHPFQIRFVLLPHEQSNL